MDQRDIKIKVLDFEGLQKSKYIVDSTGEVWGFDKRKSSWSKLNPSVVKGYLKINLSMKNGAGKWCFVHRLVAHCFIEGFDIDGPYVINHIDGDALNNEVTNLEAVTLSDNCKHGAIMKRLKKIGLWSTGGISAHLLKAIDSCGGSDFWHSLENGKAQSMT